MCSMHNDSPRLHLQQSPELVADRDAKGTLPMQSCPSLTLQGTGQAKSEGQIKAPADTLLILHTHMDPGMPPLPIAIP